MLVLTRQKVPIFDRTGTGGRRLAPATGLARGAYVLSPERGAGELAELARPGAGPSPPARSEPPDLILIGTGSEVQHCLGAQEELEERGARVRVVSMPSWERFRAQPEAYRAAVLPPETDARLAVEAGATLGWEEWVGSGGEVLGLDRFGASAPAGDNFSRFGFTAENVARRAGAMLKS